MQQTIIFASFGGHKGPRRLETGADTSWPHPLPLQSNTVERYLRHRAIDTASSQAPPAACHHLPYRRKRPPLHHTPSHHAGATGKTAAQLNTLDSLLLNAPNHQESNANPRRLPIYLRTHQSGDACGKYNRDAAATEENTAWRRLRAGSRCAAQRGRKPAQHPPQIEPATLTP